MSTKMVGFNVQQFCMLVFYRFLKYWALVSVGARSDLQHFQSSE